MPKTEEYTIKELLDQPDDTYSKKCRCGRLLHKNNSLGICQDCYIETLANARVDSD